TGIGGRGVSEVVSRIVDTYRPEALMCLGYAGAASVELGPGDLVLYSSVCLLEAPVPVGESVVVEDSRRSDTDLLEQARRALEGTATPFHEGDAVTVPHLVGEPEAKRQIGERYAVKAIDMESYWVAEAASGRGLPFLGVRAITDTMAQRAPDLTSSIDGPGDLSYRRLLAHLLGHPLDIYPLFRLSRHSRRATRNLARFVSSYLSLG
ncbi:MAG: hypothetical protein V3U26_07935, partial [Dehalococcoidia bacterium]